MARARDWIHWIGVLAVLGVCSAGRGADRVLAQTQTASPAAERSFVIPATKGTASVAVRVVADASGRPVPGANVTAIVFGDPAAAGIPNAASITFQTVAVTDLQGRALLRGLTTGRVRLSARHQSFVPLIHGQDRPGEDGTYVPIYDGEFKGEIEMRLKRGGAVAGSVLDERGDPVVGVQVHLLRRQLVQGTVRFARFAVDQTDDRGAYRVSGLTPGQYVVGVLPTYVERDAADPELEAFRSGLLPAQDAGGSAELDQFVGVEVTPGRMVIFSPWSPPPLIGEDGRATGHAATFYPGTTSTSTATAVTIDAAETRAGLDFQLHTATLSRVAGYVVDPGGGSPDRTALVLRPRTIDEGIDQPAEFQSNAGTSGVFGFAFVPAGAYTVEARSVWKPGGVDQGFESLAAVVPVIVGDQPVRDLVVRLSPGVPFSGRVQVETGAALSSLAGFRVVLRTHGSTTLGTMTHTATTREDGRFTFESVTAGRYSIAISDGPSGWYATAALLDGRDVLDDALTIAGARDDALVMISSLRTEVRGTVRDTQGRATTAGWVIVFPVDHADWRITRRVHATRPNADGSFEILALPPGQYRIAVADAESGQWRDPAFLEQLQRTAQTFSLGPGEKTTQTLLKR